MMLAPIRVGVLGCGNVGGALVELLAGESEAIAGRSGVRLEVVRVAVADLAKPRQVDLAPYRPTTDPVEVVSDPDVDVVVELIGGIEPAKTLIQTALELGKPVVTANKELLAHHGAELFALASKVGVELLFEAAVAGGIPLIRPLRESLAGEHITAIMGIVNGTTNYILTRMSEDSVSYEEALAEAQRQGLAERDPTADVEGHDAASKLAIMASIAFGADVVADDVYVEGITKVRTDDIEFARRLGYEVKMLAISERWLAEDDGHAGPCIGVRVHPAMVPSDHPLASVRGSFNAVFIEGAGVGELMLYGRGAGGRPTASAVLGDVIDAAHNLRGGVGLRQVPRQRARIRPISDLHCQYYVTFDVADEPGVLAQVASVFGRHGVSIRSVEQVGLGEAAHLVFITHTAKEGDVQATLTELGGLAPVVRVGGLLRLLGPEP